MEEKAAMKITDGAHIDIGLSRLVKNDRLAGAANRAEGAPGALW